MNLKPLIEQAIKLKLNENILNSSQLKKISKHFDVKSNTAKSAKIEVDFGSGSDDIILTLTKNGVESESEMNGKQKFKSVDAFVKDLLDGI